MQEMNDKPDAETATKALEKICVEKIQNESAEQLKDFKNEMRAQILEQGKRNVTDEKKQQVLRKVPN